MTDSYGPFDSAPWADQTQWYRHAPKWAATGVNGSPASSSTSGDLSLSLSGLNFTVGTGRAWVQGAGFERSGSPASQAIAANTNASLSRRDRIVLRRDLAAKTIAPVLIQGTPSATPTAPAFQQVTTGQWDLPLFSFLTPPNSGTAISDILDERAYVGSGGMDLMFVSTRARDSALPTPDLGQRVITVDGPINWRYSGTQWVMLRWLGTNRNSTGLPGIGLSSPSAVIANNSNTVISSWTTVTGPPAQHADLVSYVSGTSIKPLVAGRMRVSAYASSDTLQTGQSILTLTGPTIGAVGNPIDRRHRGPGGYAGSQTLDQWLDVVLVVQPNDLIGMTVYQNNSGAAAVTYNLSLQAHYL